MARGRLHASTLAWAVAALWVVGGCDRAIEPFDPSEQPRQPDLSRIFPAGAERATPTADTPPAPGDASAVASSEHPIRGTVTVARDLADRIPAGATLFLIARTGTSGPPLAVRRIASPRFPMEFSIGPEDRMIAGLPFSGPLRVTARIDRDGNATTRSPGDLRGEVEGTVNPGDRGISLVIDEVL